ncbi:hypothetical protein [Halobacillus amylolyticus]|uniref:Uncharacterized protein n=1 Tax=Halobacillus amylolyticus TaxID=2932259 RepID=A0ABY4HBR7_9BACI|nr:hypothetical protein [Halobacillus amylolyticus]UOR12001.1 hypothetical protein MUO15_00190 [Halobacillus amylolyticus]
MFYTELKNIYSRKKFLESKFPLETYYPRMNHFITQELRLGATFFSPFRFAHMFGIDVNSSVSFFLSLSDKNGIFSKLYKYECDNCDELNILKSEDELMNFECQECNKPGDLSNSSFLSDVKLLFKLKDIFYEEAMKDLKAHASFDSPTYKSNSSKEEKEVDSHSELSLKRAFEFNKGQDEQGKEIVRDESLDALRNRLRQKLGTA